MKKWLLILLSLVLTCVLAGCSGTAPAGAGSSAESSPQPSAGTAAPADEPEESAAAETPAGTEEPGATETPPEQEAPAEGGGTLIAYFSWSGNTEQVAQILAEQTGGDLFEMEPATPYTDDYGELLDIAQQEQADDARPALASSVENWDRYDRIFVGYPNWWSDAPMAVYTFLETYDFTGKELIPFNTSSSGGFGRSLSGIAESAPGATILDGLALTESELPDAQDRVTAWLAGLDLA